MEAKKYWSSFVQNGYSSALKLLLFKASLSFDGQDGNWLRLEIKVGQTFSISFLVSSMKSVKTD